MIWWFLHKLLGWDYVLYKHGYFGDVVLRRIRVSQDGRLFCFTNVDRLYMIDQPGDVEVWLTCKPSKYFGNEDKS